MNQLSISLPVFKDFIYNNNTCILTYIIWCEQINNTFNDEDLNVCH